MAINAVLAAIPVADFAAAVTWYERLLGRPADESPMDGLAEWHFPQTAVIQLVRDDQRAGNALLTLSVDDLASHVADLETRGLAPGPVDDTTSDKVLIATVSDPEGNTITLVEPRR